MKSIYKILGLCIFTAFFSCSNYQEQPSEKTNSEKAVSKKEISKNIVYSLFSTENNYQIYRNNVKYAIFTTEKSRKPIAMDVFAGECYVLLPDCVEDSVYYSSEILKNGRQAMIFQNGFKAADFDIKNGHFYVLGSFKDSCISVFKDGVRYMEFSDKISEPKFIRVYDENVYLALENGDKTTVLKEDKKLYDLQGQCTCFGVSSSGVYAMVSDKIYHNGKIFMEGNNHYDFLGKELTAAPECFSLSDGFCYIGISSAFGADKKYAGVFKNRDPFITVKPDDKPLGQSSFQTHLCGISACNKGAYSVTVNTVPEKNYVQNVFHYRFETDEVFSIEISSENPILMFLKGL